MITCATIMVSLFFAAWLRVKGKISIHYSHTDIVTLTVTVTQSQSHTHTSHSHTHTHSAHEAQLWGGAWGKGVWAHTEICTSDLHWAPTCLCLVILVYWVFNVRYLFVTCVGLALMLLLWLNVRYLCLGVCLLILFINIISVFNLIKDQTH